MVNYAELFQNATDKFLDIYDSFKLIFSLVNEQK